MPVETPAAFLETFASKARGRGMRVVHVDPKAVGHSACGYSSDGDLRGARNIVEQHLAEVD